MTPARRPAVRVLLVEDDPIAAGALSEILSHYGCKPTVAGTLRDGLACLANESFDQVVLDLMLPDGDGTEILDLIRSRGLPLKVTVATATADDELLARVRSQRPEALLAKPLDLQKLLAAMDLH